MNNGGAPAYADKHNLVMPLFKEKQVPRIYGLDFLRGLCILLMILDHTAFDFMWLPYWSTNFYEVDNPFLVGLSNWVSDFWWEGTLRASIRLTVICMFFVISGISSSFSKNNTLRGIKLALASIVLSLFTVTADRLFDLGISIIFGVLHCFTVSILIFALLEILLKDKAKYACLGLGILFFVWGLKFDFYQLYPDANALTDSHIGAKEFFQLMIGMKFYGADTFGILPYGGMFLIGVYGGKELYKYKRAYLPVFGKKAFAPVRFVGRKAVWFYLLHQLVIFGLVVLIGFMLGLRF